MGEQRVQINTGRRLASSVLVYAMTGLVKHAMSNPQPSNVRKVYMHEEDFTVAVLNCN